MKLTMHHADEDALPTIPEVAFEKKDLVGALKKLRASGFDAYAEQIEETKARGKLTYFAPPQHDAEAVCRALGCPLEGFAPQVPEEESGETHLESAELAGPAARRAERDRGAPRPGGPSL